MERAPFKEWKSSEVARLLSLVEGERRYYQEIIAAIPVGLLIVSADLAFVSANRSFRQSFGLRGDEVPQKRVDGLLAIGGLAEKIRTVLRTTSAEYQVRLDFADRSFRVSIIPFRSWDDWNEEALLVFEDAGESRKARQPDLQDFDVVLSERDSETLRFTFVSSRVESMLGFPAERWLAEPNFWTGRIHPDDRQRVAAFYQSGRDGEIEYQAVASDQRNVWLRDSVRRHDGRLSIVTTDVTQRRLLEARESLASTIEGLRTLAGHVAHDCNNLLMIVAGYGEELAQALSSQPAVREDLDEIMKATARLGELTKQLQADTRRPALTVEQIMQALGGEVALTSQADLTEEGGFLHPGRYTVLTMRGVNPTPDISLAPLHAALRRLGGDMAIAAGQVLVYLPLSGGVPEAPAQPAPPTPPPAPVLETILIVEDEPGIRALMRKILQKHGYTILEAGSEEEALRQVREQRGPIHLLITDVMLRQSTGKNVAQQVTALRPQTKVLYVSGFTDEVTVDPSALLLKPFTLGSLLEKVRQILGS